MKRPKKFIPYKRKIEGRTNYKKRLTLLVSGIPRLVVRKTNKHIIAQFVQYAENGDHVVVTVSSATLKKSGWNYATGNLPAAYLVGIVAGKAALHHNIDSAIVDLGLQTSVQGSRLYAVVKGAIDAGVKIPCNEEVFPSEDRLVGKHIVSYAQSSKQFKTSPAGMEKSVEDLKKKFLAK